MAKKAVALLTPDEASRVERLCRASKIGSRMAAEEIAFLTKMYMRDPKTYGEIRDRIVDDVTAALNPLHKRKYPSGPH